MTPATTPLPTPIRDHGELLYIFLAARGSSSFFGGGAG